MIPFDIDTWYPYNSQRNDARALKLSTQSYLQTRTSLGIKEALAKLNHFIIRTNKHRDLTINAE